MVQRKAAPLPRLVTGCARHLERVLLLTGTGPDARFHMALAWSGIFALLVVDVVWLSISSLILAPASQSDVVRLVICLGAALAACGFITHRLEGATDRVGTALRIAAGSIQLFAAAALAFSLLAVVVVLFCCLGSSAALPLQDAMLAHIDRQLGFDWIAFVARANANPWASWLLVKSYQATPQVLIGTLLWLCLSRQDGRLAEFLALLSLTSIGIAVGMMILPAAGAYAHYHPAQQTFSNFSGNAGLWHYDLLMQLRSGSMNVIDFNTPNINCLVTFPSGHTVLAILTTYALRASRWTLWPAMAVNAIMIVSTIPEGGHHLFDVIVSGAIAAAAVAITRLSRTLRQQDHERPTGGYAVSA
jgi:membrane-associated phospholipid phosphatase